MRVSASLCLLWYLTATTPVASGLEAYAGGIQQDSMDSLLQSMFSARMSGEDSSFSRGRAKDFLSAPLAHPKPLPEFRKGQTLDFSAPQSDFRKPHPSLDSADRHEWVHLLKVMDARAAPAPAPHLDEGAVWEQGASSKDPRKKFEYIRELRKQFQDAQRQDA